MSILAIDPSLTRTGWAGPERALSGVLIPPRSFEHGMQRLWWIREKVLDHVLGLARSTFAKADLVVIEGYSLGQARGTSHQHEQGELGGVIRMALYEQNFRYVDVAPASLKKFTTGKGNASKAEVLVAAVKRLGYEGSDDNEADALWLWTMAMTPYGNPPVPMPAANREALLKVQWLPLKSAEESPAVAAASSDHA